MKKYLIASLGLFCLFYPCKGQNKKEIQTSFSKITQLSFFAPIEKVHIDNIQDFVLVSKDRFLNLSCLSKTPIQTHLSVSLAGNQIFSFLVNNTLNASKLTYFINEPEKEPKKTKKEDLLKTCQKVVKQPSSSTKKKTKGLLSYLFNKRVETQNANLKLTLLNLIIDQNKMYFHIEIQNKSLIDFKIQQMAFETKSKIGKKKVSLTLRKLPILSTCQNLQVIPSLTTSQEVLVLDSFSLSREEVLQLEILEKPQGKRHLKLKIPTSVLEKAKPLH